MTIIMRKALDEKVLLQTEASCVYGAGSLCITSHAIAYEVHGKGLYLNFIPHDSLIRVNVSKSSMLLHTRKIRIFWVEEKVGKKEGKMSKHFFDIRSRQYVQIESILKEKITGM